MQRVPTAINQGQKTKEYDGHRLLPSLERRASSYRVSHPSCFLRSRLASKPKMHLRETDRGGLNRSDTRKRTQVLVLLALQVIDN